MHTSNECKSYYVVVVLPEMAIFFEMKNAFFDREVFGIDWMFIGVSPTANRDLLFIAGKGDKELHCKLWDVSASSFRLCFGEMGRETSVFRFPIQGQAHMQTSSLRHILILLEPNQTWMRAPIWAAK